MESKPSTQAKPPRRKVQIVYYLSRSGQVDHPHLMEGYLQASQDGLRLKDVKRWLVELRGRSMPNSFAWSYKRNYKNGFIWHDLADNDLIQPLFKNEYVLMGSEIRDVIPGKCACGGVVDRKDMGEDRQSEPAAVKEVRGVSNSVQEGWQGVLQQGRMMKDDKQFSLTAQQLLEEIRRPHRTRTRSTECNLEGGGSAMEELQRSHIMKHSPRSEIRVHKGGSGASGSSWVVSDHVNNLDVATQTGDGRRYSMEIEEEIVPAPMKGSPKSGRSSIAHLGMSQDLSVRTMSSTSGMAGGSKSTRFRTRSEDHATMVSPRRQKPATMTKSSTSGPILLKQLLSCGSAGTEARVIMDQRSGRHRSWVEEGRRMRRHSGSVSEARSICALSDGSMRDMMTESSPESVYGTKMTTGRVGNMSPGVASVCSSTSRRSSVVEIREAVGVSPNTLVSLQHYNMASATFRQRTPPPAANVAAARHHLHHICSPCVPNISSFTVSNKQNTITHFHAPLAPRHSPKPPSSMNSSPRVPSTGGTPAARASSATMEMVAGGSASWRELLWSPLHHSASHKDKRRMKP